MLTHGNLIATIENMVEAWEWSCRDVCLHTLPLHHVHGLVNALMVPLYVGAQTVMLPHFSTSKVSGEAIV